MKAEIIAVGSELLTPDRQDTNSLFLTAELNKLGIEVLRKTIVGDERALLLEAFRDANVDGALAASVFHKQIINIGELKAYLAAQGVEIRVC